MLQSIAIKVHPLYLMGPAALGCSYAFHLPVGTPPNALISAAANIRTKDFVIAGIGPSIISAILTPISFIYFANYIFQLDGIPEWLPISSQMKDDCNKTILQCYNNSGILELYKH